MFYRSYFRHYRIPADRKVRVKGQPSNRDLAPYSKHDAGFKPASRGGMTECTVIIEGQRFTGRSLCSLSDNFDYKVGRKLAFNRVMEKVRKVYADANVNSVAPAGA